MQTQCTAFGPLHAAEVYPFPSIAAITHIPTEERAERTDAFSKPVRSLALASLPLEQPVNVNPQLVVSFAESTLAMGEADLKCCLRCCQGRVGSARSLHRLRTVVCVICKRHGAPVNKKRVNGQKSKRSNDRGDRPQFAS